MGNSFFVVLGLIQRHGDMHTHMRTLRVRMLSLWAHTAVLVTPTELGIVNYLLTPYMALVSGTKQLITRPVAPVAETRLLDS